MSLFAEAIQRDTRANQPAAGDVVVGTLYYVTDENVTERSNGSAWEDFSDAGSATVDSDDVTYTPTTVADWDGSADPGDVEQALDQLAERVKDIELAGAVIADGDKGDITTSSSGAVWTIDNDAVTYAKIQNVSATDRLLGRDTAGAGDIEEVPVSGGLEFTDGPGLRINATHKTGTIQVIIDGGGSVITTGIKGDIEIPIACTITAATLLLDQSGSIVIDIWKDTYANFPPTDADSITAAAPPTVSTATKSQDTTLTGWTTSITAGDVLRFNVDSITTATRATLSLKYVKA